jgi:hypothetical protein
MLTWTVFTFPEYVGIRKIELSYGQLVATLHSLPGRWPYCNHTAAVH